MLCTLDVSEALKDLESEWSSKDPRESWVALSRGRRGEHFVVEVAVGGRKCGTFVDIGSTRNYISRDCLERLHLKDRVQHLSRPVASTLANKERMVVRDYVKDVVCTFSYGRGELNHKISFLVSDDLPFDMLLGMYYLEVAKPQFDWDKKVLKHKLPDGRTVRLAKHKARRLLESYGCLCASAFYNYYKQNQEEGMYLVYVSEKGEAVKTPPEIEHVVAKFPDLFKEPTGVVEREIVHAIEIIPGSKTPEGRVYRMAPAELDELRRQMKELTEKGWIRPSTSPFGSPVMFVPKKGGSLRMCIGYRGLNAITMKIAEPLPRIDDLLDRVQGCKYYSKIDLKFGYHQIAIRPEDQHKTAFQTRYGLYEFVVMPFGLCNAPGTFQHAMNKIFHDYLDKFVVVYLDDILIFSKSVEEHAQHLEIVLSLLRQHKYKVNLDKCLSADKPRTQAPLGLLKPLPIPVGRGQSVSMDFMDTLVTSRSGKRHIFVIIDRFTKYARLIAMPETARTEHVIKLFMDNWVHDFGLPKSIVSDRDVRFTSELWKKTAEQLGSQLQMTSGNHHEANGQAEKMNRVVQHLLMHYIKPSQDDWDEKMPLIASLYNNVVHSSTDVSPNQLHLGWKPRSALDFLLPENRPAANPGSIKYGVQYKKLLQQAVEHIKKSQEAMIASQNKHRRQSTFQAGERVWAKASELGQEFGISRKLMPQYFGPWEVLDIVGDGLDDPSYVIRIPGHLRTYPVFHASKLAPFSETNQFPSRRSMLPPTMDGHVDIDDILEHRDMPVPRPLGRGRPPKPRREYKVRFRHHTDPKEDRWFTREELVETAPQVAAEYERQLKGKAPAK
ncbi:hypothetical protein CBR_g49679 [Chara braunii]|uniref:Integrase catalytic domain-containing protein n=1 Tax=Chara braunii TaxID=69332 RepID=A0A388M5L3_CHABU|nr:hypothetical protein CBR_g49679 [Chara braunii]|eukprot:GBG89830.1 hypothetical protein CBR_g49679 [Chara braunii]